MQPLESAFEHVNYLMQLAKQRPNQLLCHRPGRSEAKWKSIHQKLKELYLEECSNTHTNKNLVGGSFLLKKLVSREKLNCLVVNLYPGNEGYSLMLKTRTGNDIETIRLPYEESELLQYLDNEELPPILVDLLERSQASVFYSGCVIVEVRDYRRSSNPASFESYYILLQPTTQTLVCDVGLLSSDGQYWSAEDKQALEAQLLLATSEPLCLDPSISVTLIANRYQYQKKYLSTVPLKKMSKRHTQLTVNRKRKFEQCAAPPSLKVHDFITKRKKTSAHSALSFKIGTQALDSWKKKDVVLVQPKDIDVEKYAKALEKPKHDLDSFPVKVEEYIMEIEQEPGKLWNTHITIFQRPVDEEYLGKLTVSQGEHGEGSSSFFTLGDKTRVLKYLNQFREITTKEGQKAVRITHKVPGMAPVATYIPAAKEGSAESFAILNTTTTNSLTTGSDGTEMSIANLSKKAAVKLSVSSTQATSATSKVCVTSSSKNDSLPVQQEKSISAKVVSSTGTSTNSDSGTLSQLLSTAPSVSAPKGFTNNVLTALSTNMETDNTTKKEGDIVQGLIGSESHEGLTSPPGNIGTSVNLAGLGLAQNLGLSNLVTLTGVGIPQGLSVPISLTVVTTNHTSVTSAAGVFVSGLGNQETTVNTSTNITPSSNSSKSSGSIKQISDEPSSTAIPVCLGSSTMIVSSGMVNPASAGTNILSVPFGVAGGLNTQNLAAQLMASSFKPSPQGLRTSTPVSLLQVSSSQQPIPLLQRPLGPALRVTPSPVAAPQTSTQQKPSPSHQTAGSISPAPSGTPPPSLSPALSVAQTFVAPTSQQQQIHLALQKQLQHQLRQHTGQLGVHANSAESGSSCSKSKKKKGSS
ncbi:transcription factor SPT20 homolog [Limulus polyphemus]|uniref:Transcription factor SPT20 homolog n=1 Tax=Limulus polyphemus TaxID=6850 RepID=A0ABM1BND4_LIMPO|nr:transcription factor SPT20 homolog [Limulus polyphemus]